MIATAVAFGAQLGGAVILTAVLALLIYSSTEY